VSPLQGRRALVTGSTERTGLAIAEHLAAQGAEVILHGRHDDERTQTAVARFAKPPPILFADVTSPQDCAELAARCAALGGVDILVNNVGVYAPRDLAETDPTHWRWTLAGNLDATFYVCHAFLDQLLARQRSRIINLGFIGCDRLLASDFGTAYQIAKTGVHLLTKSLALRFAAQGLTANTISPGQLDNSVDLPPTDQLPMRRPTSPLEIAQAVAYLASEAADYTSGAQLEIAGAWMPPPRRIHRGN
jgi:NAD(P)-dependent dehydrogenase (short-subunit alcohol dehydrogenase family)